MFADTLAQAGANVALLDLNEEAAQMKADAIQKAGGSAKGYRCNVLDKDNIEEVHQQILADFGPCDILLNGAGGSAARVPPPPKEYFEPGDIDADTVSFFDLDKGGVEFVFSKLSWHTSANAGLCKRHGEWRRREIF